MDLIQQVNKHKNKIVNLAIIILALIISNKIYKQQNTQIRALEENNALELKKNKELESISQLEKRNNAYKKFLVKRDASSCIKIIGDIAKESGVKILGIKPLGEQKYPDYIKIPFGLEVDAFDYHTLGRFISNIENYKDLYVIDDVNIKPGGTNALSVNLTISNIAFAD